ncbi:MAG TPA: hypothetical protein EYP85_02850 [Armatimonadetes bacterium]|nr:hypothetical protein [Armatimonadota bacterium]
MKTTRKQLIFLTVFVLVLLVGSGGYIYYALNPSPSATSSAIWSVSPPNLLVGTLSEPEEREEPKWPAPHLPTAEERAQYAIIAQRNVFEPLLYRPPRVSGGSKARFTPPRIPPVPPVETTPQAPERPTTPSATSASPTPPPKSKVTVTGLLRFRGQWHVLLENLDTHETGLATVGEVRFGYLVRGIRFAQGEVVLERSGELLRLSLGALKEEQPLVARRPREEGKEPAKSGLPSGSRALMAEGPLPPPESPPETAFQPPEPPPMSDEELLALAERRLGITITPQMIQQFERFVSRLPKATGPVGNTGDPLIDAIERRYRIRLPAEAVEFIRRMGGG